MVTPAQKLAESLSVLNSLQKQNIIAIQSRHLTRTHRERLKKNGFIVEVIKGWYIPAHPNEPRGESTAWYASFWDFCGNYLNERFGKKWCLGPEQSLSLHTGNWTVPQQLLVRSPKGDNKPITLLYHTSLFNVRLSLPSETDIEVKEGLRLMTLSAALVSYTPSQFMTHAIEIRAALAMVKEPSDVLRCLLSGGHSIVAGRLAGAFRSIGRDYIAEAIVQTMRTAGYAIQETDPWKNQLAPTLVLRETSPQANRLRMMWEKMRKEVILHFPKAVDMQSDIKVYSRQVEEAYVTDAYHSLSIEGYKVSVELIERVRAGDWNPDKISKDRNYQDALAARGYWQAFQKVKESMIRVLKGHNSGRVAKEDHSAWYNELFGPSVTAGIIKPIDLAGYRNRPVYIRRSRHVPPRYDVVGELMSTFFLLLQQEEDPAVRVVLGHFIFVYIHPYVDGNGRIGRFLMNIMLAAGGYPWTVIPVDRRSDYMAALESASVMQDIKPFTLFLAEILSVKG